MATIVIDVNGGTPQTRRTITKTVSTDDLIRFVNAHRAKYGPVVNGNGASRPMTDAETVDAWAAEIFSTAVAWTKSWETQQADIPPIVLT